MSNPNRILVTYATRLGSTAGVANIIGRTLIENGLRVEVRPMDDVKDVEPYRAVIVGSAIRDKKWLPEAMQFVQTHRATLAQKPFAAFLVCMTLAIKNGMYREAVGEWLEPVRRLVQPMSEGLFAGVLDIEKVPSFRDRMMFRVSVASGVWSEGDHRDWNAICAWANDLPSKLHL
jgi:menaquinone-dependent protoporphyrinogen oxidase